MYATDDPSWMVGQGKQLDAATAAELRDIAADETSSLIPTETVLRAAGLFMAECGYPAVLAEVEAFLAEARR